MPKLHAGSMFVGVVLACGGMLVGLIVISLLLRVW
jgi:hypothetical protein